MVSGRKPAERATVGSRATAFSFDGWYRFPAAMRPDALEQAATAAQPPPGGIVLDPFGGTGRTGTFVVGRGDAFVGIEAHPILADLGATKLRRPGSSSELRELGAHLQVCRRRRQTPRREPELLRQQFEPTQLSDLAELRDGASQAGPWEAHVRWAVLGAVRELACGGWPYGGGRRARTDRAPLDVVRRRVACMADDLACTPRTPRGRLITGDARDPASWSSIQPGSVDASISSPPYLNQLAYAEMVRTEAYFLGMADSWAGLNALGCDLMASCTQQLSRTRRAQAEERLVHLPGTQAALGALTPQLRQARASRARGKPYDELVGVYLADISNVLQHLYRALSPGAPVGWVIGDSAPYGVYVDTPTLIGLVATELGFEVVDDVVLRLRGSRWKVAGRHDRPLTERLLTLRKPGWFTQESLPGL